MGLPEPRKLSDDIVRLGTPLVNWYLLADDSGVVMVDSGLQGFRPQLDRGLELLGRSRADLRAILLTHGDADHVGVAARMQKEGDETPIHLSAADLRLARKERKRTEEPMRSLLLKPGTWRLYGHFSRYGALSQPKIEGTIDIRAEEPLDVPGRPLAIATPGHTEGHVAFLFPEHGALFAGDSLCTWHPISGRRGPRTMAFNVSNSEALESLSAIEDVDAELLLVGHGEPWTEGPAEAVRRARSETP